MIPVSRYWSSDWVIRRFLKVVMSCESARVSKVPSVGKSTKNSNMETSSTNSMGLTGTNMMGWSWKRNQGLFLGWVKSPAT